MGNSQHSGPVMGLTTAVFIVFLVLKLLGRIDWSWWWITSPLWIPFVAAIAIVVFLFILLIVWG